MHIVLWWLFIHHCVSVNVCFAVSDHSARLLSADTLRSCLLVIFLLSDSHLAIRNRNVVFQR